MRHANLALSCLFTLSSIASQAQLSLWYRHPAAYWEACVPLGNGRLGAMPDGGVEQDKIVLNDITLWSGGPQNADLPDAYKYLPEIQSLILKGENIKAQQLMSRYFKSAGAGSGQGEGANVPYGSYQVLGTLSLNFDYGQGAGPAGVPIPVNYIRRLSLDSAIATTTFQLGGVTYKREYLTSFDHDVVIIRLTASARQHLNFKTSLARPERASFKVSGQTLEMTGQLNNGTDGKGMKFLTQVRIMQKGGQQALEADSLLVTNADTATIYISSATDYHQPEYQQRVEQTLQQALTTSYEAELGKHIKTFQHRFNRVSLALEGVNRSDLPTDERLESFRTDTTDTGLPALYFQYGRYLLIASTRPNLLPPNLQGLWANSIQTPWNGDYHLDINIQMNHWPLDETNLGDLNPPFLALVKGLVEPGKRTARSYYNSPGWVAHVITNPWGYTSPGEDYSWGAFNTGSAWLCQMLYTHYEFSKDIAYLKQLYPILKGSAEFYLHALVKEKEHGWLVTAPSNSPENEFVLPDGTHASVTAGPTIDNQLIRYLFQATAQAAGTLQVDAGLRDSIMAAEKKLPPDQVNAAGKLMEWLNDYPATDPHHRHVSPLWGLYPGVEINPNTPGLENAAKALLEERGDIGTGWSLAWKVNLWARLHDGDHAFKLLHSLLKPVVTNKINMSNGGGSYINLFCAHPPFQIDGNFGGAAGITEMLLQSCNGYIEVLPALPSIWKTGHFTGLKARGNVVVDASWSDNQLQSLRLLPASTGLIKLKLQQHIERVKITTAAGSKEVSVPTDRIISIQLGKGQVVEVRPV